MVLVRGVEVDDDLVRGPQQELPPVLQAKLVGFVDEEDGTLAAPDLLRLVYADELDQVTKEDVVRFALVVQVRVVCVLSFEYLEEVPHGCGPQRGECLPGDGDDRPGVLVLVAELHDTLKDGVRLARSRPALVDLYPGVAPFDVVVCGGLLHRLSKNAVWLS